MSDRNPLDDVAGDPPLPSVVEACRAWVGVASEKLDVFQWNALGEQIRDRRDSIMLSTT